MMQLRKLKSLQILALRLNHIATTRKNEMAIELINKNFELKETQFKYDPSKKRLSETEILGLKGQKVILLDDYSELVLIKNGGSRIKYYTLFSNLIWPNGKRKAI